MSDGQYRRKIAILVCRNGARATSLPTFITFSRAPVAKRTFPLFGLRAAVAKAMFVFWPMNPYVSDAQNRRKIHIFTSTEQPLTQKRKHLTHWTLKTAVKCKFLRGLGGMNSHLLLKSRKDSFLLFRGWWKRRALPFYCSGAGGEGELSGVRIVWCKTCLV